MTQLKKGPRRFARLGEVMNPSAPRASEPQARGLRRPQAKQRAQVPARLVTLADRIATARAEERKRMADVFASDAVKGRETAAAYFLTQSDMTSEKIISMLAWVPCTATAKDDWRRKLKESASKQQIGRASDSVANHGWAKIHENLRNARSAA